MGYETTQHLEVLFPLHTLLLSVKQDILNEWICEEQCAAVLEKHEIDRAFFAIEYGGNVFDYFMGVISGDVIIGECPAMAALIKYLKHKEIRSDELFTLCTHFKRSVLNATYRMGINTQEVFVAISHLFDRNFAGVLKLYTDTIYQKEQEAIEAGRAKEYFLSNMSHEIRTPLNAILGFVALLKGEKLHPQHQKHLDIIAQSGESLLHIINDILDFSKLRSGVFAIDPIAFRLRQKMVNTLELYIPSANLKSISIDYSISSETPECVIADPFRVQQIVGNLLSNAIKFSPHHTSIGVEVTYMDEQVCISVLDHANGIPIDEYEKIFDPFYQASEGTRYGVGGSGLGLSISRQLARQMGGDILLESVVGEGSVFSVIFPIKKATETMCTPLKVEYQDMKLHGKVLVAEDNEANAELIRMMLERYGLHVEVVPNGLKAYERFCEYDYDLVILDEQMPLMSGTDALHHMQDCKKRHTIPIVSLSANALSGAKETALSEGYSAFLTKPIDVDALEHLLMQYLSGVVSTANEINAPTHALEKILGLRSDQVHQLLGVFEEKVKGTLPDIRTAIDTREFSQLARLAHSLKGACLNFRFTEMARLMELIELSGRQKDEGFSYHEAVDVFVQEYNETLFFDKIADS